MTTVAWIAIVSITVTILIVLVTAMVNLAYRHGHHAARIEQLEFWRQSVRGDMHEVSEQLSTISKELAALMTLVEERTERRKGPMVGGAVPPDDERRRWNS